MAKHTIEMSCGHEEVHQIYGPYKDRDRKAEYIAEGACRECWEEQRREENAEAAQANVEQGLPKLKGSEKQVAWAESIRAEKLADRETVAAWIAEKAPDADQRALGEKALKHIVDVASESWWIDNRSYELMSIFRATAKKMFEGAAAQAT